MMHRRLSLWRHNGFVVLTTLVAALLLCSLSPPALSAVGTGESFEVVRVVDGDTLVLRNLGTVRLIGIDTPETVDPRVPVQAFGKEATAFLRQMVEGQTVRVEYDTQRLDKYGRTLAYLYLADDSFVNLEMVRQGFAHAYLNYPFRHMEEFRRAEREARDAARGLWGQPSAAQTAVSTASVPTRVWVNTGSRVYHCPGTRYYGNTARGEYMTESEAQQSGNRAAYGRSCGPTSAPTPVETNGVTAPVQPPETVIGPQTDRSAVRVWVNTASKVYHCPGTRYYGNTKQGAYMSESDAQSRGHRAAAGRHLVVFKPTTTNRGERSSSVTFSTHAVVTVSPFAPSLHIAG